MRCAEQTCISQARVALPSLLRVTLALHGMFLGGALPGDLCGSHNLSRVRALHLKMAADLGPDIQQVAQIPSAQC